MTTHGHNDTTGTGKGPRGERGIAILYVAFFLLASLWFVSRSNAGKYTEKSVPLPSVELTPT